MPGGVLRAARDGWTKSGGGGTRAGSRVYVIPIDGVIDLGLAPYVERTLIEAATKQAAAVVAGGRSGWSGSTGRRKDRLLHAQGISRHGRSAQAATAQIAQSPTPIRPVAVTVERQTRRLTLAGARRGIVPATILGPCWAHSPEGDHRPGR